MDACRMEFTGKLLKRGFWLYVWDIRGDRQQHVYVGRTGDTSSPFRRIGEHLDSRLTAKGNAMLRQLRKLKVQPETCTFEMTAIGPIFEEAENMETHRPLRDKTASLEGALAQELGARGYHVIGTHPSAKNADPELLDQVLQQIDSTFPDKQRRRPFTFEPIKLPPGAPSISDVVIRDRGAY